jgi:hypothetical protein
MRSVGAGGGAGAGRGALAGMAPGLWRGAKARPAEGGQGREPGLGAEGGPRGR